MTHYGYIINITTIVIIQDRSDGRREKLDDEKVQKGLNDLDNIKEM